MLGAWTALGVKNALFVEVYDFSVEGSLKRVRDMPTNSFRAWIGLLPIACAESGNLFRGTGGCV